MASKSSTTSSLLIPCLLLIIITTSPLGASAHSITQILSQFSDFTKFNNLITQTLIAADIDSRRSITVLAVNDTVLSAVSGQPMDVVKKILQVHVALDYYDADKLKAFSGHSAMIATLFQASGQATGQNGLLNVSRTSSGQVVFGSAAPGSRLSANFVQVLVTHPYNISVIQVGDVIIPPGIGLVPSGGHGPPAPSPAAPAGAPNVAPFPASLAPKLAPVPAPAMSPKTASPAASPSSTLMPPTGASPPTTDEMPPAPSSGASEGPSATVPSSEAPMMSPPAPPDEKGSTAPGASPSYIAGAPGPAEVPRSAAVRVAVGSGAYVAIGAALIVLGIL